MRALRRFLIRLTASVTRRRDEERVREELEDHIALRTDEHVRAGMAPGDARRQAVLDVGAVQAITEDVRDEQSLPFLEHLLQDTRIACLMAGHADVVRQPGGQLAGICD